jgi:hypothetical protein
MLRKFRLALGGGACIAVAALTLAVVASSPAQSKNDKVYFADLFGGATQSPSAIFFTANSGPRVTDIKWKGWGNRRTVGKGRYEDNQPVPCPPMCHPEGWAKIVLKHPRPCKQPKWAKKAGKRLRMYTEGTLSHPDTDTGEKVVKSNISSYATYCKPRK